MPTRLRSRSPLCLAFSALLAVSFFSPFAQAAVDQAPSSIAEAVVWKFNTGRDVTAAPIVDRGVVYFGSTGYAFYALEAKTGRQLWKFDAPFSISSRGAIQGDTVCFECGDILIALDRTSGKELWRFVAKPYRPIYSMDLTDYHRSSPVIADGLVFYGDDWGNLNGIDLASGKLVFQYTTESARPIRATPAVDHGRVFFGDWEGDVYSVSLAEKKLLWKHHQENTRPYYGAVVSEFRVLNGVVYFGSQHDIFAPLDATSGEPVWSYTDPNHTYLPTTPLLVDGKAIIGTTVFTNAVLCLDQGKLVWSFKAEGIFFTAPIAHDSRVFVNSTNFGGTGYLYTLDLATGKLIHKVTIEKAMPSAPAIAEGLLFLGAGDGCLYALDLEKLSAPIAP